MRSSNGWSPSQWAREFTWKGLAWTRATCSGFGTHAKGGLLDEEDAQYPCVDEATQPIAPAETANKRRKDEAEEYNHLDVVLVLKLDDFVLVQIRDVRSSDPLGTLLQKHPTDVRVEEALSDTVRILVGVGIAVAVLHQQEAVGVQGPETSYCARWSRAHHLIDPWTAPAPAAASKTRRGIVAE